MGRVYVIAEAGVNHNGNIELAKQLVDKAKEAGADCIKFQTFLSQNIASKVAGKAEYQKTPADSGESQLEMLRRLELSYSEFAALQAYCQEKEIEFLSTAFDLESIDFLNNIEIRIWKIPSGEITNLPYLLKIAGLNKPVMLSTGMSTLAEVKRAVAVLQENGAGEITLLHCTTEYPAPYCDVNLNAMLSMKKEFGLEVGYSDHTQGMEIAIAAVAMGASVIEKHFTLDRTMVGPDHKSSLEPDELAAMIKAIRHVEKAFGDGIKQPAPSEIKNIAIARKSIVAAKDIACGAVFTADNLTVKRPGNGISPMQWFDVIEKTAARNFEEDELIEL